jgi:hypothetical protein
MEVSKILNSKSEDFVMLSVDGVRLLFTYDEVRRAAKLAKSVDRNRDRANKRPPSKENAIYTQPKNERSKK